MNEQSPRGRESKPEEKRSLFSSLPSYPGENADAGGLSPIAERIVRRDVSEVACGECEQHKPGVASYTVLHIIFLVLFTVWRVDTVFKCPGCMRAYLAQRLPLALLLATVFAPIILLWWGVLFLRTLGR